jgi:dimethylglycine catabolism B
VLRLPIAATHKRALETCVFCPKLCRASCPVSNAEASETLTPWGKMSLTYFAARGDVPIDETHAEPAWACTGCHACRDRCDHKNEPAVALFDARADFLQRGVAPEQAAKVAREATRREEETNLCLDEIERADARDNNATTGVLVGCAYARTAKEEARDALHVAARLTGGPVRAIRACCGLPSLYAGDREGFQAAAARLAKEVAPLSRVVVVDPGCARALLVEHPRLGINTTKKPELLLDLAFASLQKLKTLPDLKDKPVRWFSPCQLGRGLGRYDEPRAVLAKICGREADTFLRERDQSECSGGGGLLPVTRPKASEAIADARIHEHHARGGGTLVTACASSLKRFRSRGEPAVDLMSLLAQALDG